MIVVVEHRNLSQCRSEERVGVLGHDELVVVSCSGFSIQHLVPLAQSINQNTDHDDTSCTT